MRTTDVTGQTCVGDLRLSCLDVGFDVRGIGTVRLPEQFSSAGIERDGRVLLIEGTRAEMVAAIKEAGYKVEEPKPRARPRRPKSTASRRRARNKSTEKSCSL
jgi:hypothetical protein